MTRFLSALAVSFSFLALAGVGFVLTSSRSAPEAGVGVELDRLRVRLNDLEDRLQNLAVETAR